MPGRTLSAGRFERTEGEGHHVDCGPFHVVVGVHVVVIVVIFIPTRFPAVMPRLPNTETEQMVRELSAQANFKGKHLQAGPCKRNRGHGNTSRVFATRSAGTIQSPRNSFPGGRRVGAFHARGIMQEACGGQHRRGWKPPVGLDLANQLDAWPIKVLSDLLLHLHDFVRCLRGTESHQAGRVRGAGGQEKENVTIIGTIWVGGEGGTSDSASSRT